MKVRILIAAIVLIATLFFGFRMCQKIQPNQDTIASLLDVDKTFHFPDGFPKDPGSAGDKTLEGIDSDKDGVRDDLQRWIFARYPDDLKKRKALTQFAKDFQKECSETVQEKEINIRSDESFKAMACAEFVFGIDQAYLEMDLVTAKTINTNERTKKYFQNDLVFSGHNFGSNFESDGSTCE